MYSKEEASRLRQQFWITFGKYMKPIPSAEGLNINWINYKTGVKYIFFKMDADKSQANISIQLTHTDEIIRAIYFEQFATVKTLLKNALNEEWDWQLNTIDEYGTSTSKISNTINDVSIYNQQQWPQIISFLKPRLIALDEFWTDVKPIFEDLG